MSDLVDSTVNFFKSQDTEDERGESISTGDRDEVSGPLLKAKPVKS